MTDIIYNMLHERFSGRVKVQKFYSGASFEWLAANYNELGVNTLSLVENGFEPTDQTYSGFVSIVTNWHYSIFVVEKNTPKGKIVLSHDDIISLAGDYTDGITQRQYGIQQIAGFPIPLDKGLIIYEYRITVNTYS